MAKRKKTAPRKVKPVPVIVAPEVVIVSVPIEKTKTSTWQRFVDWLTK